MITIQRSPTADTHACDFSQVSIEQLKKSSDMHRRDIRKAMAHFGYLLLDAGLNHDNDKVSEEGLAKFHSDFVTGFKNHEWWDNHRKVNRHHINAADGIPKDVDLVDVLEHVADCVMAGMARSTKGSEGVYAIALPDELLQTALKNTVDKLKQSVLVVGDDEDPIQDCLFSSAYSPWKCHGSPERCREDGGTCVACPMMQRPVGYTKKPDHR